MMKKILVAAHDPGGSNVIGPIIAKLADQAQQYSLILALLGPARQRIPAFGSNIMAVDLPALPTPGFPNEQSTREESVTALLDQLQVDLIFTATSYNSNLERLFLKHAQKRRIPSAAIIDYWANYAERFTLDGQRYFPDVLFVTDKKMAEGVQSEHPSSQIIVSGNPHLRELAEAHASHTQTQQKNKKQRYRFFSENIHHYFPHRPVNEFSMVATLVRFLAERNLPAEFLVRPHPMESHAPWDKFLADFSNQDELKTLKLGLDTSPFPEVLTDSFIAIGITSMALLETTVCNIPTFSYQIGLPDTGYLFLPFAEYRITPLKTAEDLGLLLAPPPAPALEDRQHRAPWDIIKETFEHFPHPAPTATPDYEL
jgi:hypothetical protein